MQCKKCKSCPKLSFPKLIIIDKIRKETKRNTKKKREKEASKRSAKRFGFVFFSLVAIICWYMGLQKLNEDVTTGAIMVLSGAVITGVLVGLVILKIMNAMKKNK